VTGAFHFTITGQAGVFDVAAGACLTVPNVGTTAITVTEQSVPDVSASAITVQNAVSSGPPDLYGGSITLTMSESASASAAKVTFTNASVPHGVPRWTGDGSINPTALRITHDFGLHCSVNALPNHLDIKWGDADANRFHLGALTSVSCFTVPAQCSSGARAPEIIGSGTGSYNGAAGATIKFTFTDAGEGAKDFASYNIEANGGVVLSASGCLQYGNQQYHPTR
jgi:hypothetical protein